MTTTKMKSTSLLQASLAVLGCTLLHNSRYIDAVLAYVWAEVIYPSKIFRHDSFEVLLSSLLFAIYTFSWVILDFYVPAAHVFRILDSSASNQSWKGRENALFQETMWYSLPWMLLDFVVPRRHLLLTHFSSPPTLFRVMQDIFLSFVLYDFLFYVGHLMMHRNRYLFRTVHSKHHTMGTCLLALFIILT